MSSNKADQATVFGLGQNGIEYITGTGVGGPWVAVQCVGATVFTTFTSTGQTGSLAGPTFSDQFTIRAPITAIVVASGGVLATKGNIN